MSLHKQYKLADKAVAEQKRVVSELETLARSIGRCEQTIVDLKAELEAVNQNHQGRRTTQEDIDYLTDLLKCANKKLGWEKQMASLQKRIPAVLQDVSTVMNDPKHPPGDETREAMTRTLQAVEAAMRRLDSAKVE